MFRCVARYGYKDIHKEHYEAFEQLIIESLDRSLQKEALEVPLRMRVSMYTRTMNQPILKEQDLQIVSLNRIEHP